ncbi:MAG: GGDEF domain-containing protein [bacterium]|nr:GGDEF domain-containing protein [bacterium]
MGILSLRTKLVVALGAILLLSFVSTSALNFLVARRSLRDSAMTETLPLISDTVFSEVQTDLLRPIHNSSLMAHDAFLKDWVLGGEKSGTNVVRYLRTIKERYGYFTAFFVSESTKNYYYYDGILKQISPEDEHDVWYYEFKDLDAPYDLDVDDDEASGGTLTVFINHRLEDYEGRFLGVTGVGLKMDTMGQTLASFREKYGRLIYMVDSDGLVQVHPDAALVERTFIGEMEGIGPTAEKILASRMGTQTHEFDRGGKHLFVSARYFPALDWFLIVEQEEAKELAEVRSTLLGNLLVGAVATAVVLLVIVWVVNRYQRRLQYLATTDELTGLLNRRYFMELANRQAALAKRYGHSLSLLMIDADRFKAFNDEHGHAVGDEILKLMAEALKQGLREVDVLARFGGEEFVVLLPEAQEEEAYRAAERLREAVESRELATSHGPLRSTISVGVATLPHEAIDLAALIKHADKAMYRAKDLGRNRVCAFVEQS